MSQSKGAIEREQRREAREAEAAERWEVQDIDRRRATSLAFPRTSYPPGSTDKREIRRIVIKSVACLDGALFTERQVAMLAYLAWKYRRQIPAHLVPAGPRERP